MTGRLRTVILVCVLVILSASFAFPDRASSAPAASQSAWDSAQVEEDLRRALETQPESFDHRISLANLLSYQSGRVDEAIAQYRLCLKIKPGDRAARHGLARSLGWTGRAKDAIAEFDALIAEDPEDAEANYGRGQLARWSGDRVRARRHLLLALARKPGQAKYHEEYGLIEVEAGQISTAQREAEAAREHGGEPLELERKIAEAAAPKARARVSASEETNDFRRANVIMQSEFLSWRDIRVRVQAGYTRFEDDTGELDRTSFGVGATYPLPRNLLVSARYTLREPVHQSPTHEWGAEIAGRPTGLPVALRVGGSRHSMVDHRPGFEEIEPIQGVGSGGNSLDAIRNDRQIWEGYAGVSIAPIPGLYAYAEFAAGWINDGNRRLNTIAGMGFDLVNFLHGPSAHSLDLQYDLYYLDYQRGDSEYFSPQNFIVHTPGLSWRWRANHRFVVGLEAGVPVESGEQAGWRAGGFVQFEIRRQFFIGARIRHMENASYRISSGTLGIQATF